MFVVFTITHVYVKCRNCVCSSMAFARVSEYQEHSFLDFCLCHSCIGGLYD
jgi:hypothetical protein